MARIRLSSHAIAGGQFSPRIESPAGIFQVASPLLLHKGFTSPDA